MVGNVPGILPKTALVGSRAIYYPFTIPQKLNDSATLVGEVGNGLVAGLNSTIGGAYAALQPRGPAKWLLPLFDKVGAATEKSQAVATRNKTKVWDPFSQGMEQVGRSFASPGTYWYLKKAGIDQPTQDQIKSTLQMKFFHFPDAGEVGGGTPPAEETPVPSGGPSEAPAPAKPPAPDAPVEASAANQAAEGAGEVAAA